MKISIIIPVYNVEQYIQMCLDSVADQTLTDGIECILIDDCGKDHSVNIAEEFINNYEGKIHFSLIHHKENGGLSATRNTGINASNGEYLYFLDSDDTITPNCMELMWSYIEKYGNVDLVQGSFYENETEKSQRSTYLSDSFIDRKKTIKRFLLTYRGDIIPAQSRLIRKDFIIKNGLFFKKGIIHEDNYWTFFLAKHVNTMCYCGERTYYHRYNPNSITGNVNKAKEAIAYKTIIRDCCQNIDLFLVGEQKEYIFCNYLTCVENHFYESEKDKEEMLQNIHSTNNIIENILLRLYLSLNTTFLGTKMRHLLIRLYKL